MTTNVLSFLENRAKFRPDVIAVTEGERNITYGKLLEDSRRIGSALGAATVPTEPPVASASKAEDDFKCRKHFGNHYGPLLAGSVALFCVWILNGLWHGPAWHYIFFGMYHFTWILCGNLLEPLVLRINGALGINPHHFLYRGMQILRTAALVVIGELFFRAETLRGGFQMFKVMITQFSVPTLEKLERLNAGIDRCDIMVVGTVLLIVLSISILNERGVFLRQILAEQNVLIRWAVLDAAILSIVVFGAYGSGYAPVDPMYAKF